MGEAVDKDGFRCFPQNAKREDDRRISDVNAWFYEVAHGIEVVFSCPADMETFTVIIPARALRRWARVDAMLAARADGAGAT